MAPLSVVCPEAGGMRSLESQGGLPKGLGGSRLHSLRVPQVVLSRGQAWTKRPGDLGWVVDQEQVEMQAVP